MENENNINPIEENVTSVENDNNVTPTAPVNNEHAWSEPAYEPVRPVAQNYYSPNHYTAEHGYNYSYDTVPQKPKKEKKKRSHGFLKAVCIILVSVLLSSTACYFVAGYVVEKNTPEQTNKVVFGSTGEKVETDKKDDEPESVVSNPGDQLTSQQVYAVAQNEVVGITTSVITTNNFGQTSSAALAGTGFILSEDGYIMTNYHVIEYAVVYGGEVTVMMNNGDKYTAQVVASHPDNDVALLKIEANGLDAIDYSYDINVGETIYAVGNPLGELAYTMTSGIVSALDRVITTSDNTTGSSKSINMFQIDAAVNSGNSGGPVYNAYGEVVGMVTAKYSSSGIEGLGFAIPIEDALNIASQLLEKGYVSGAQMGVKVLSVNEVYSAFAIEYYGYPDGVCIMEVNKGEAADKAGLRPGDIVTSIDGVSVTSTEELKTMIKKYTPGESAVLRVYRIGNTLDTGDYIELEVVFDETTNQTTQSAQPQSGNYMPNPGNPYGGFYGGSEYFDY